MLRRVLLISLVLAFASGCSTVSTVKGWFGGGKPKPSDPAALTVLANPIAVQRLWSTSVGDGEKLSWIRMHPVLDGNRLYALGKNGNVLAIDATSGKKLWQANAVAVKSEGGRWKFWHSHTVEAGLTGGPGVGDGMVVAGGRNGEVVALDADTGAKRWSVKVTSEVLSAPLVMPDRVVVRSNDGRVFGLDPADGSRKWVFDRGLPTLTVRGNSAPVAGQGLVYIGYDDGTVVALRDEDGLKVWEQIVAEPDGRTELDRVADIDGELQVGTDAVFATSFHGQTVALSPNNGNPLWNRDLGGYAGIAMLADRLLISDKDGDVWAIDRSTGNALWKQDALARRQLTTPVVQGDYAVVGDYDGYLHWLRIDTGEIVGRAHVEKKGGLRGTPQVSADGVLYAETTKGKLAAYKLGK
jgi:outer membrane protein assembly factor BamB